MKIPVFLQSVTIGDSEIAKTDSLDTSEVTVSLFELIKFGGWWLLPLFLLLAIAIYIFVERYQLIQKANKLPKDLISEVESCIRSGDVERAKRACASKNSPFARMLLKGLERLGNPLPDIAAAIENEGKLEIARLEKKTAFLATIAGAAPMIGFLGTVSGMIIAFMKISHLDGNVNPAELAGGIYQAMITTAFGLIVGIPAYVGYNVLTTMVESVIFKMETTTMSFIDLLQEPVK